MVKDSALGQRFTKSFWEGTENKYFWVCGPYSLCYNYSTLPWQHKGSQRPSVSQQNGHAPIKLYSQSFNLGPWMMVRLGATWIYLTQPNYTHESDKNGKYYVRHIL